jgi:hypothetical protein
MCCWTAKRVRDRLVAAYVVRGGLVARGRDDLARLDGQAIDGAKLVATVGILLGRGSCAHRDLVIYAWARSHEGVRALCRARGWPRGSFYRRVDRAAGVVAARLNGQPAPAGAGACCLRLRPVASHPALIIR